jgi:hypothetical protein
MLSPAACHFCMFPSHNMQHIFLQIILLFSHCCMFPICWSPRSDPWDKIIPFQQSRLCLFRWISIVLSLSIHCMLAAIRLGLLHSMEKGFLQQWKCQQICFHNANWKITCCNKVSCTLQYESFARDVLIFVWFIIAR